MMGALIFHESLSLRQLFGALVIVASLVANTLSKRSAQEAPTST